MQQSDCKVLWEKCLEIIKDNLSEEQFNTWFRPIVPHSFNEKKELRIIVPSNFFGEYIEANYRQLLMSVVQRVMGKGVSLFYRTGHDLGATDEYRAAEGPSRLELLPESEIPL